MVRAHERGFSLVEFTVVISVMFVLVLLVLTNLVRATNDARESETMSRCHTIQVAIERYQTDNGEYPRYLLGGDIEGWEAWHEMWDGVNDIEMDDLQTASNDIVRDPLVEFDYLASYPVNPFVDDGESVIRRTCIDNSGDPGMGDPRFGMNGDLMGQGLDDPRVLFSSPGTPTGYVNTMRGSAMSYLGVLNMNSPNSFYCMGGIPNWVTQGGGASDPEGGTLRAWWPGEFFYRAGGTFRTRRFPRHPMLTFDDKIWDWPYQYIDKYMLGAYGSLRTEGLDVIRLTTLEGHTGSTWGGMQGYIHNQFYQDHSDPFAERSHHDFNVRVNYSDPEVFGGGEKGLMPQFPYYDWGIHDWLYGAPDGHKDGIILVLMPV